MSPDKSLRTELKPKQIINLSFKNITYSIQPSILSRERKDILKGVSGLFKSGELTAVMGPSGAGKTSFLNVLSGYIKNGVGGIVYANGLPVDANGIEVKSFSSYIMHQDSLNPSFTARETMLHAANLKLGHKHDPKVKRNLVDRLLDNMSITEARNTLCGKLSNGEKKRLSICLELLDNPPVLFLDEPTTGLDSTNSRLLVTNLKELAASGRTVICAIHQPSGFILSLFDHLYLLESGRTVYQGDTSNLLPFLDFVGLPCPIFHNPADFVMDIVSGEFGDHNDRLIEANFSKNWRESESGVDRSHYPGTEVLDIKGKKGNGPSQLLRYRYLVCHLCKQFHRDWIITYVKCILHTFVAFTVAALFYNHGDNANKVQNNIVYLFLTSLYIGYTTLMPATLTFPSQLLVLKKEHFNNWHKFATFFLSYISIEIPLQVILILEHMTITYFFTGQLLELWRFCIFAVTVALETIISDLFGIMLGSSENPVNGIFIGSAILIVFTVFGGCFVPLKDLSGFMRFISSLNFFRYAFELKVTATYGLDRRKLPCPEETAYCHITNSTIVFEEYGIEDNEVGRNMLILIIYVMAIMAITYLRLKYTLKKIYRTINI